MGNAPLVSGSKIYPVLLSGGSGSRLWPMSREHFPKQLLALTSERSLIQETALRVADRERFEPPLVICNEAHRFVIAEQLRQAAITPAAIILEPVGRNTAAAVAVAALQVLARDPEALILVLPADHLIRDVGAFQTVVACAAIAARAGNLVTFGIVPTAPETGYGYIRRGPALSESTKAESTKAEPGEAKPGGAFRVAAFVEKPPLATAERYLAEGDYFWNSGMFLFPASRVAAELERFEPAVMAACQRALATAVVDLDFLRLGAEAFAQAPSISIDYAVMERTDAAVVVPAAIGWTDVGAWSALWEIGAHDADGNVQIGDTLTHDSHNCYVRSEGALTAVLGIDDAVIVVTDDAVLVAARDRAGEVKTLVERMKKSGRSEPLVHRRIHRPWGFYQSLHVGERFQVKRLTVNPGARLSLQFHHHRAEHWVVVNGTALVTRGEEQMLLRENESVFIPLGTPHRLENPGRIPLNLIEVQSGSYLGEDDIVRLTDNYGRL